MERLDGQARLSQRHRPGHRKPAGQRPADRRRRLLGGGRRARRRVRGDLRQRASVPLASRQPRRRGGPRPGARPADLRLVADLRRRRQDLGRHLPRGQGVPLRPRDQGVHRLRTGRRRSDIRTVHRLLRRQGLLRLVRRGAHRRAEPGDRLGHRAPQAAGPRHHRGQGRLRPGRLRRPAVRTHRLRPAGTALRLRPRSARLDRRDPRRARPEDLPARLRRRRLPRTAQRTAPLRPGHQAAHRHRPHLHRQGAEHPVHRLGRAGRRELPGPQRRRHALAWRDVPLQPHHRGVRDPRHQGPQGPIEILALGAGGRKTVYAGGFLNGGLGAVRTDTGVGRSTASRRSSRY